jgi:multicomponent Na+:H+ antiporter subunit F
MEWLDYLLFFIVGLGLVFTVVRFLVGPNLGDRVVSLDTFNMIVIGVIALLALLLGNELYLDIAIVYAILAFLETIVFARYLEGSNNGNR